MIKYISIISLIFLTALTVVAKKEESNLPLSNQATFVESYSSSEVTIKATGLGGKKGFFNDRVKNALLDVKKAAVNFVLKLGTDPLLNTPEAKSKFNEIAEDFFKNDNVNKYISWEADKVIKNIKVRLPNGDDGRKIVKMVRVNKKRLTDDLVAKGIIVSREELAQQIGMPFIMVIPETPKGQTPLEVFDKNPYAKHGAAVIESYLTARKYDVVVPRASEQLNSMTQMQSSLEGAEEDISYQLALALGSDVYIVFAGQVSNQGSGKKASVSVKAYETTTARLLGTETGYSKTRPGAIEPLIEEAVNDAIDKVLQRVTNYWIDDMKKGLQYKLIFKFIGDWGEEEDAEEIQWAIQDVIDAEFNLSKENVVSKKTMDYLVWAKKSDYKRSSMIYRLFAKKMRGKADVDRISINKKLIILGIKEE